MQRAAAEPPLAVARTSKQRVASTRAGGRRKICGIVAKAITPHWPHTPDPKSAKDPTVAAVEQAVQADLEAFREPVRRSALASVALHLAQRLDGEPSDREASTLARELRLTLQELHRLAALDDADGGLDVSASEMGD